MIKLKDLLNENSPGYENRQFGDPLPTLEDIAKKYQEGKEETINEEHIRRFQLFKGITADAYQWNFNYVDEFFIKEDYTKINMYDLIFNKNANKYDSLIHLIDVSCYTLVNALKPKIYKLFRA